MNLADALAGYGLLALLIAIPISGVLAAWSGRGVVLALSLLAVLFSANLLLASYASNYGDAVGFLFVLPLVDLIAIGVGGCVGAIVRAARSRADGADTCVS